MYREDDDDIFGQNSLPGIRKEQVEAVLNVEGQKAVVLQTFGSGNATRQAWFIEALEKAISSGMIILNVSQCDKGSVEQGRSGVESMHLGSTTERSSKGRC